MEAELAKVKQPTVEESRVESPSALFIEYPTICSPYDEPSRHHKLDIDGRLTNDITRGRRKSDYLVPQRDDSKSYVQKGLLSAIPKKHDEVARAREAVKNWTKQGCPHITPTTAHLLDFWQDKNRLRPLFFCQIEALRTAIYLNEVEQVTASKKSTHVMHALKGISDEYNALLLRIAFKMATGSGKTLVMAMLIAYHHLNRLAAPRDERFADSFLIVSPGLTIKDRLQVLSPRSENNYYLEHQLVPANLFPKLERAPIEIINFHALKRKERGEGSSLARTMAGQDDSGASCESDAAMVDRVCRELGDDILVLNDEAHHCYRRKDTATPTAKKHPHNSDYEDELDAGDAGDDAEDDVKRRNEEARVWISGLEAIERERGVKLVYDLSATPFFLLGSGEPEGKLFPWVVSDFSLTEAIESGIVKIPRVPSDDNSPRGGGSDYRNLWPLVRGKLPRKGARREKVTSALGSLDHCSELESALQFLYSDYEKVYAKWDEREGISLPPVFIVVCQNTNISRLVQYYIAGFEDDRGEVTRGKLELFRNDNNGELLAKRDSRTILVDSVAMDSDKGDDSLREMMNSVGKVRGLGAKVRCVVSVSMLTEGWDTNTVTHILGVRAFGTQLLCEQVIGRALRRTSYDEMHEYVITMEDGSEERVETFAAEYADIYGVPFDWYFPVQKGVVNAPSPRPLTQVRALESREHLEIRFPRVSDYGRIFTADKLRVRFSKESRLALTTELVATKVESSPVGGGGKINTVELKDSLGHLREAEVAYKLAHRFLSKYFRGDYGRVTDERFSVEGWRFANVLALTKRWLSECLEVKDDCFMQLLCMDSLSTLAIDKIFGSLVTKDESRLSDANAADDSFRTSAILPPYDEEGSTRHVHFGTRKQNLYMTERSHISHVVPDTRVWERALARKLEDMSEVLCYARNEGLGFEIPYEYAGMKRMYRPDFIAYIDDGYGLEDPLRLIIEVSGRDFAEKAAKVSAARNFWLPAVNDLSAEGRRRGGRDYGRWDFIELRDVNTMTNDIRSHLKSSHLKTRVGELEGARVKVG